MSNISIEVPIYDSSKESMSQYFDRIEKFKNSLNNDKYNIVLKFFNDWFDKDFHSLTEFKSINETQIFLKPKKNRKLLRKYCPIFKNKLGIETNIDKKTKKEDISPTAIHLIGNKILNVLEYKMLKINTNKSSFYKIVKL
tara:strand:+ start:17382 stop:17801 length:420 start_codon:yes stop_codon:yes gene_type:complete